MKRRLSRPTSGRPARLGRPTAIVGLGLLPALFACGAPPDEPADRSVATDRPAVATDRPATRIDTLSIEGMREPIAMRLHRAPDDFPLPFTTYVPEDMAPSTDAAEGTAHFTAEFGGVRNEDAFVHLYVFPEGTARQEALATAKGYKTGRGLPVSQGLEPIADQLSRPDLAWATEAYRFLYQSGGESYAGSLGVGEREGRFYMMLRHYPAEYGDGFAPRAALLFRSWRWADGSPLHDSPGPGTEPPGSGR